MEETVPQDLNEGKESPLCVNCNLIKYEEGYSTKLCTPCREKFIHYPIPKWIWIFSAIIGVIMLIGLVRMPNYLKGAIHLSRAENAMDDKKYVTAQRELELVVAAFPGKIEAQGQILIASAHNFDFVKVAEVSQLLEGKKIEDSKLYSEMTNMIEFVSANYIQDTLLSKNLSLIKDSVNLLLNKFDSLESKNHQDVLFAGVVIADYFYGLEEFKKAENILSRVLKKQHDYYPALSLLAAVKRNTGDYNGAINACNQMLELNREDVKVIAQKARIELKRKNDKQAAIYATEALAIDSVNILALEAQAMVAFYAGRKDESRKLLSAIHKKEMKENDSTITSRLRLIINGIKKYR